MTLVFVQCLVQCSI